MKAKTMFVLGALALPLLLVASGPAWADPAETEATVSFDPASPVPDGTLVDVTGTVVCDEVHGTCTFVGEAVTDGSIRIQQAQDLGDNPVACDDPAFDDWEKLAEGAPDGSGQFTLIDFDTTGLGGMSIAFRIHYVTGGGGAHVPGTTFSECVNLVVLANDDPLPDDTITYTQGFYGASPVGEDIVDQLIDEATCDEINDILEDVGVGATPYACGTQAGRDALALFLTGTVGPGADDGFLPSGFAPDQNLAAQKIALLLNLNLGLVLTGDDIPILSSYFINIDAVQDLVDGVPDGWFDPVLTTGGELGVCTDVLAPIGACDPGTVALTPLGEKVEDLDIAGTTVEDILVAADDLLDSGDPDIDVNGVTLTREDVTDILGLINESYDEGTPTGFVTAFDAD